VLLLAVLFLMVLVFHLSLSLARLSARQTALAQEIGLMTAMTPMRGVVGPDTTEVDEQPRGGPESTAPPG